MMKTQLVLLGTIAVVSFLVGSLCWTYSVNEVFEMIGSAKTIAWWQGGLIGLVPYLGQVSIPVAVIVWIVGLIV